MLVAAMERQIYATLANMMHKEATLWLQKYQNHFTSS
jgi:hypothetical protein